MDEGAATQQRENAQGQDRPKARARRKKDGSDEPNKRKCVSSACIACRRRKSKCDGNLPACAACSSVYNTECVYDIGSDHRRKGVYKSENDSLKTRNSTLQILIQAILNYPEEDVPGLVQQIRTCESLDTVAEAILAREAGDAMEEEIKPASVDGEASFDTPTFETQLASKMNQMVMDEGSLRYLGGTSNLIYLDDSDSVTTTQMSTEAHQQQHENPVTSWTEVTSDPDLIMHLMNMYFTWHYTYFTCLSKSVFYRDFLLGRPPEHNRRKHEYCTPLLVNAMLALGCHFTARPGAREVPDDSATAGDHFFKECKRLIMENDEFEKPKLPTVQALALMSVREAGCGREAKGWVYSGMSFRMACDLGLNLDSGVVSLGGRNKMDEEEEDVKEITFWGCFLFDKCWSNYLGRLPQLPLSIVTVPKFEVFPTEDADTWAAYTDSGFNQSHAQPSRTRAVALQISTLCEISGDLMKYFYDPAEVDKAKTKQNELKKLSDIHQRLEAWRRNLPKELEPKEGGLPQMLVMHMFFQLLYIHLFRPFLKYTAATSPLPAHVSPRKLCTQAAQMISKLLRLYKRSHGLRQICNIAVYIGHSACTIHLLNLPDKNAKRDIVHGVKHLEEIAESWLCARRTLGILNILAKKWNVELPEEATMVLARAEAKFGPYTGEGARGLTPSATASPSQTTAALSPFSKPAYGHANNPAMLAPRRISETKPLPPASAAEMNFRGHRATPSVGTTNASTPRHSVDSNAATNTTAGSPSDLFGGVDALLRESQDWWLRDQNQLAMGFENWNVPEQMWLGGTDMATYGVLMNGGSIGATPISGNAAPNGKIQTGNTNGQVMNGFGAVISSYDDNEWYQ